MLVQSGIAQLNNSHVVGNTATAHGGGIGILGTTLVA